MTGIPKAWHDVLSGLLGQRPRVILGLAGTPGAGKSSAAAAIAAAFAPVSVVVPMDGFHLANVELARLNRADRKGAPDTFDAAGYAALLTRIRNGGDETIYAPEFRREIEEPIAGAIPVLPEHRLIVTEGNYLLLQIGGWALVRPLLDACWYIDIAAAARIDRLTARHVAFGRTPEAAHEWVFRSDEANARLIEQSRPAADFLTSWPASA